MRLEFVDSRSGEVILTESHWDLPPPRVQDVLELHNGPATRWVVQEVDWVFEGADRDKMSEIPVDHLAVVVIPEDEYDPAAETRARDPMCECGHKKSMHAAARCLGDGSTCSCQGFRAKVRVGR